MVECSGLENRQPKGSRVRIPPSPHCMETVGKTTPIIDSGMVQGLEAIYLEHSQHPGYPNGKCIGISHEIAERFGLTYHHGFFTLDFKTDLKPTLDLPHAWCEDGNMTIVDLTASQFNTNLQNRIPEGVMIIKPEDELYSHYRKIDRNSNGGK